MDGSKSYGRITLIVFLMVATLMLAVCGAAGAADDQESANKLFIDAFNLYRVGKLDEAVAKFEAGLELAPQNAKALFFLGETFSTLGDIEKARKNYELAIAADPGGETGTRAMDRLVALKNPSATISEVSGPQPDQVMKDPVTGIEFVFVKGGCFRMGDTFGDGFPAERPVHEVCVDDFWVGKYEVTQAQWQRVMGNNPSDFNKGGDYPVETVNWADIQAFIEKLSTASTKQYRLPTEAEWEYAARSGGRAEKWPGTSEQGALGEFAWYNANSGKQTQPVGQKKPNGLGLYDMSGNVSEWCRDWYEKKYYEKSPKENPKGPERGQYRVIRGGSWLFDAVSARVSDRVRFNPSYRSYGIGFRLVSSPR